MNNVRIISKNKVVTVNGNVNGRGVKQYITRYISEIYCVDQVVNKLNGVTVITCLKCQYLCNGVCIDRCAPCERKASKPKKVKGCPVCPGDGR